MTGYIQNTLIKFQHPRPKNTEDVVFKADTKQYGEICNYQKKRVSRFHFNQLQVNS